MPNSLMGSIVNELRIPPFFQVVALGSAALEPICFSVSLLILAGEEMCKSMLSCHAVVLVHHSFVDMGNE